MIYLRALYGVGSNPPEDTMNKFEYARYTKQCIAENESARENRQAFRTFADGKKENTKPVSSFGNTGIPVVSSKRAGKRYQSPRRDRLYMAEKRGPNETALQPKLRTATFCFVEGRVERHIGDIYADTGKRRETTKKFAN